jgi:hypothetical protein
MFYDRYIVSGILMGYEWDNSGYTLQCHQTNYGTQTWLGNPG